ncbi:MAG: neutral zinc metallopeptidase [Propionibacteriaceae bacterium]|nr:neutral zinc metallopeptidase [Propionibacteriaceae bacterium]
MTQNAPGYPPAGPQPGYRPQAAQPYQYAAVPQQYRSGYQQAYPPPAWNQAPVSNWQTQAAGQSRPIQPMTNSGYRGAAGGYGGAIKVIIALAAVCVFGIFVYTLASYLMGRVTREVSLDPVNPVYTATRQDQSAGWQQTASEQASPEPTATQASQSPTSQGTSSSEQGVPAPDSDPPPIPTVETYTEAAALLTDNAFYDQNSVGAVDCVVDQVDITSASTSQMEKHLNELTACLWRVWNPPVTGAGYELPRPPVTTYTKPITTGCGKADTANAFYCGADQRVYYAMDVYEVIPSSLRKAPFIADTILAHEFGHALQARTGILFAETAFSSSSKVTEDEALDLSRRTEMQADCAAGMFTASVAAANSLDDADVDDLAKMIYSIGDDVLTGKTGYSYDHGLGKNRSTWFFVGVGAKSVGSCNTYTASDEDVG